MTAQEFYVTFGVQHRHMPHPIWADAHPDGWLTVVADNEEIARGVVCGWLGREWAGLYRADDFRTRFFPLGELRRIDVSTHTADVPAVAS